MTELELFSVAGVDGHLREVNEAFALLLGADQEAIEGTSVLELVHPDDLPAIVAGLAALQNGTPEVLLENRFRRGDRSWIHLQWVARPVPGTELWWAAGRDTTEFHRLLAERLGLRARFDLAVGTSPAAMWDLVLGTGVLTWDAEADLMFGDTGGTPTTTSELIARAHPDDAPALAGALDGLQHSRPADVCVRVGEGPSLRYLSFRGTVIERDRRARPVRVVGISLDVTAEKAMEEQMLLMVMRDALTGVPNRRALDQALRSEWRRCGRSGEPLSVLMIDLDDFKSFNDTFGHVIGDEALCAVARALNEVVKREGDVLARFGGEEFAVVLPGADVAGARAVADRAVEAVRRVTVRQAPGRRLSISVGAATRLTPEGDLKPAGLLARADQALYVAKDEGKDRALSYETSVAEGARLAEAISSGLQDGEFRLYYQPIVDLATGEVTALEALARWQRPGHGLVLPDGFVPVAEESDLVCRLGSWALLEAANQIAAWRDQASPAGGLPVAVNVSDRHAASAAILTDVQATVAAAGVEPSCLQLELTETVLSETGLVADNLEQLRALGTRVAMDDFGTGYMSIGRLPNLPIDTLKIDRSFVGSADPRLRQLVPLMAAAAKLYGLTVVAEGVEDDETRRFVSEAGCDLAQGYHFARPMPADDVTGWLADRQGGAAN